ncbi:protein trichome birefringence-like 4 [Nicotiana tabacum]|uniref:Protein trichome birefringence-like 4 n=2 Tax=Nicotiana TaxID=4085 RepID=A0A1S4A0Q3_TOBAC|nr:PREDICTED: protein trichome birefringence-like 4 [Nicotiana sylvestris]XP_016470218.1 PREDICTED: protein trichome birefringence-like 4 [Nicotiana tabacum]
MADSPPSLPTTRKIPFPPPTLKIRVNSPSMSELKKSLFSPNSLRSPTIRTPTFKTQKSMLLAYAFTFLFVTCAIFFVFNNPSINHSFKKVLNKRSQFSTFFSHYFSSNNYTSNQNSTVYSLPFNRKTNGVFGKLNDSNSVSHQNGFSISPSQMNDSENGEKGLQNSMKNEEEEKKRVNLSPYSVRNDTSTENQKNEPWWEVLSHCDVFDGKWVKDDANPLYEPGSCPFIDEPFDCYRNGRPDNGYEKFRWQPKHCNIPRLNAKEMLELLRGKRLVYVGDSLNRNMWESMVCLLRNSVEDKSRVFEVSGREDFKKEGAYSFIFADYNFSVEFVRSTFLVQEWEMPDGNGSTKETLRLDLVERSCDKYKGADILVFNTGHWWTHEKTSEGKGYYQEGSHVYGELNVVEAFRKAMTTWARWIETNVDPLKTDVFFRGYSVSHFSGGEWYAGGKCDSDTEPLQDEKDLSPSLYPSIMGMLEDVLRWMKTPVYYLNVTIMSDFRKDGHPSIYRKPNMTDEERRTTIRYQDCSHWCLPGVPDTWNELLYAQLLMKHYQKQHKQQQQQIGS